MRQRGRTSEEMQRENPLPLLVGKNGRAIHRPSSSCLTLIPSRSLGVTSLLEGGDFKPLSYEVTLCKGVILLHFQDLYKREDKCESTFAPLFKQHAVKVECLVTLIIKVRH